jgi:hypothetical protein
MNTPEQDVAALRGIVLKLGYLSELQTVGCSEEVITSLDKYSAVGRLPEYYRQFLLSMGGYIDGRYLGSYLFTCEYLEEIQKEGHDMAKKFRPEVPADAFFFATYDFVDYFYFRTMDINDNPPVYMCSEKRSPLMMNTTFFRFLLAEMGDKDANDEQPN